MSKLADDFYHLLDDFKLTLKENQLPRDQISISYSFGFNGRKRSNVHFLTETLIVSAVGNVLLFTNLKNLSQNHIVFESLGSIGAIAVNPSKTLIAVGEKSLKGPNIYIFEYPSLRVYRVLKGGTEKTFSCISFHPNGKTLASIGSEPDYTLTIWDWKQETIILRSRAFSQEVFNVAFSPSHDGVLTTSGMGHIKFWKMAHTFTGLKLQGHLGKFGLYELSDIDGFVELADGKIVTGSESGNMLLWEGGFIKCEITGKEGSPCHKGTLRHLFIQDSEILTAGDDGYVRVWDLEAVDTADVAAGSKTIELECTDELLISKETKITSLVPFPKSPSEFLVQDECGHLWRFHSKKRIADRIFSFHSGSVAAIDTCPFRHEFVSIGSDGTLRIYDYMDHVMLQKLKNNVSGTFVGYANKKIDPTGQTLLAGFGDGTIRFYKYSSEDLKYNGETSLALSYVNKPHSVAVKQVIAHMQGHAFATVSSDDQIFLFTINDGTIKPVGFYQFQKNIKHVNWVEDPTHFHLNVALASGELIQLILPNNHENTLDTRLSYDITKSLSTRPYNLEWIANGWHDRTLKKLQDEVNTSFLISKKQLEDAGNWNSTVEETKRAELSQQLKELKVDRLAVIPVATLSITVDQFLLAVTLSSGISEIYQCSWKSQGTLIFSLPGSISFMRLSSSGQFLSVGTIDGSTYLLDFAPATPVHSYWSHHMHDLQSGSVTAAMNSFDDSHYFSSGQDGNLFVLRNSTVALKNDIRVENENGGTFKHPSMSLDDTCLDPRCHSLQESKIKAKQDAEKEEAEANKQRVRFFIKELRQEYIAVTQENLKLPKEHKLDMSSLEVDPNLKERIITGTEDSLLQLKKETSWISEKVSIGPKKLQKKFLNLVENDFLILNSIKSKNCVSTFRTLKPDLEIHSEIEGDSKNDEEIGLENEASEKPLQQTSEAPVTEAPSHGNGKASETPTNTQQPQKQEIRNDTPSQSSHDQVDPSPLSKLPSEMNSVTFGESFSVENPSQDTSTKVHVKKHKETPLIDAKSKREARKQMRLERAAQFQELLNSKPDENYEDPKDVSAIKYALSHMGDYKLKTGENYIVPESERIDADKKRRQMILLKEAIRTLKLEFNEQVYLLRDAKEKLVKEVKAKNKQIESINKDLANLGEHSESAIWNPEIEDSTYPEKRFTVTDEETLEFKKKQKEAETRVKDEGGFGSFGAGSGSGNNSNSNNPPAVAKNPSPNQGISIPVKPSTSHKKSTFTQIQAEENERKIRELTERRDKVQKFVENAINDFDQSLNTLRREKVLLEGDVISCEMKYILLYREWVLLKEFELNDISLADKLKQKKAEKRDITAKLNECQEKLFTKKTEVENVIKNGRLVYEEFLRTIGDANKHEDFLTKIFRRKIKRSRKAKATYRDDSKDDSSPFGENQDAEQSDSQSESDDYDSDSMGSESSAEDFDETCPKDCDANIYNRVLELRNQRLDQEDILGDIQKIVENMKKEHESLVKKEKNIDSGLAAADKEIQEFQTQKQQKLNELDVLISLRMHQLQYLDDNALPKNLTLALVFTEEGLERLRSRIRELQQEKADIRRQHADLKKMHISLVKSKKEKQSKLMELEARAYDVQMLKFGRVIDLEKLERMGVNKTSDELRERIQAEESKRMQELDFLDDKIYELREKVISVTKEHTQRLESFVNLNDSQRKLENALNHTQNVMTSEYRGLQKQDMHEMERLKSYAADQKKEIERLKNEIHALVAK